MSQEVKKNNSSLLVEDPKQDEKPTFHDVRNLNAQEKYFFKGENNRDQENDFIDKSC